MSLTRTFSHPLLLGALALTFAGSITSCKKKEGCTDPTATNYDADADKDCCCEFAPAGNATTTIAGETYYILSGTISDNRTLDNDRRWLMSGGVFVGSGATLNIEEGTRIYAADDATTPFLSIQRGGRINAVGTAAAPIVFTTIKTITGGAWAAARSS